MSLQFTRLLKTKSAKLGKIEQDVASIKDSYGKSLAGTFIGISSITLCLSYKCTRSVLKAGKVVPVTKAPIISILGVSYMAYLGTRDSLDQKYSRELLNLIDIDDEVIGVLNEENQVHIDEYRRHIFR